MRHERTNEKKKSEWKRGKRFILNSTLDSFALRTIFADDKCIHWNATPNTYTNSGVNKNSNKHTEIRTRAIKTVRITSAKSDLYFLLYTNRRNTRNNKENITHFFIIFRTDWHPKRAKFNEIHLCIFIYWWMRWYVLSKAHTANAIVIALK